MIPYYIKHVIHNAAEKVTVTGGVDPIMMNLCLRCLIPQWWMWNWHLMLLGIDVEHIKVESTKRNSTNGEYMEESVCIYIYVIMYL